MTRRFFVPPPALDRDVVALDGALARRISSVLRLRAGDEIVLFDGGGIDVRLRIEAADERVVRGSVVGRYDGPAEPPARVGLYQSVTKGERFDWLLEKATEVGVGRFVPLIAARSVVRPAEGGGKLDRWRRIVTEAAEQCGRGALPNVEMPQGFDAALASAPGIVLMPFERAGEGAPSVQAALDANIDALFALSEVSVFIGPEGGFEPEEVERAVAAGAAVVTMGARVLRSETAGLVAATLVMQALGELR